MLRAPSRAASTAALQRFSSASACVPSSPGWARLTLAAQQGERVAAPEAAPALSIYLLGSLRVFAEDRPLADLGPGKGRAIFKLLALHAGEPVARDVLMDLFWPGAAPAAARNCLHVALHALRKALGEAGLAGGAVSFRHGAYGLDPTLRAWVDTEAFGAAMQRAEGAERRGDRVAAAAHYRAAQALYRGPLLVEDRYEGWLVPHRERLRTTYLTALQRLADFALADGDDGTCIATTQRLLDEDACNEQAHRQLMRSFARSGQAHLALRQYHHCVDALARELDLIPSAQTVALFQQIRRREPV